MYINLQLINKFIIHINLIVIIFQQANILSKIVTLIFSYVDAHFIISERILSKLISFLCF